MSSRPTSKRGELAKHEETDRDVGSTTSGTTPCDAPPRTMADGSPHSAALSDGEQTWLRTRFSDTVFHIAAGLRNREELFATNPQRYPYSNDLRLGIQCLAALHIQYAKDEHALRELLDDLSESAFIRTWCTRDLATWIEQWSPAAREALNTLKRLKLGPLAEVSGNFFNITADCEGFLELAGNGDANDFHEFQIYTMLREASQEAYVFGRKFLILHPILSWEEHTAATHYDLAAFDLDPLDRGELAGIDQARFKEFIDVAYERAPLGLKVCPTCGWTMSLNGLHPMCLTIACSTHVDANEYATLPDIPPNAYRLRRGVMRYIAKPGKLELEIARKVQQLALPFELWPHYDTCDILIKLPSGRTIAVDAKDHRDISRLTSDIEADEMREVIAANEAIYIVPADISAPQRRAANHRLANKPGYSCKTLRELTQHLKRESREAR